MHSKITIQANCYASIFLELKNPKLIYDHQFRLIDATMLNDLSL